MATAAEIESYGGDKNLAFGSTALPAVSTDVVVDLTPGIKFWQDYANNKLLVARENLADLRRKQLLAQKDLQHKLDTKNYKIWQYDRDLFTKKYNEAARLSVDVAQRGKWEDINDSDYIKATQLWADLEQFSQYSTQQQEHYNVGDKWYNEHVGKVKPTTRKSLDDYAAIGDPFKRMETDYVVDPEIGIDVGKLAKEIETELTTGKTSHSVAYKDQYGQIVNDITERQQIDLSLLPERLDARYKTVPEFRNTADYIYSQLTPQEQVQIGNNPAQAMQDVVLTGINATTNEKQQFRTDWQSQFATRQALTKPIDSEIVDYSLELTDSNSQRYTFDKGDGQKFAYAASPYYVVKVGLKPVPIDGFVNDNGKVYAVPKGQLKILEGGKFDWDKTTLIPITDPSSQFITPTLSLQGRSAEQIQDVQNYGNRVDTENKLKIPKGQNVTRNTGTSSTSGSTQTGQPQTNQQPKQQNQQPNNQPQSNTGDVYGNYLNVLGSQYKSMGESKPEAYKNSWQYRPQEIDKYYDEALNSGGNRREKGNLLTNAGYNAIDKFENTKGTPQGTSMNMGSGYSKTQEAEIRAYVEKNIGMDVWNKMPEKLQTQVYSLAFNSVKDDRIIKGLAQALAPEKIKTDKDRQDLSATEAKKIIKNAFGGSSGMIKVILNGQIGEIPADNWEAFKKKYPSATKQ